MAGKVRERMAEVSAAADSVDTLIVRLLKVPLSSTLPLGSKRRVAIGYCVRLR
jgi:hypothetical protein